MTTSNFIDHDTWFARLPGVVVSAGGLITDPAGRILLVKPNYRDHWTLPGGICEHGDRFVPAGEAADYLAPYGVRRVLAALDARAAGATAYQPTQVS
jgi:hypothetical protein